MGGVELPRHWKRILENEMVNVKFMLILYLIYCTQFNVRKIHTSLKSLTENCPDATLNK